MSLGAIDLSELIADPDFARAFTIRRQTKTTADGITRTTSQDIAASGAVQVATSFDIQQLPEGDRLKNVIMVASQSEIKGTLGAPDVIVTGDGASYRVIKVEAHAGYWKAFAEGFAP